MPQGGPASEGCPTGEALDRHLQSVGAPGTGKSTVLVAVATAKLLVGEGFASLDPHGQAATRLRTLARAARRMRGAGPTGHPVSGTTLEASSSLKHPHRRSR